MTRKTVDLPFKPSPHERKAISAGMKTYAAAIRTPRLTWDDWRSIALAVAVASDHLAENTGGEKRTPAYTRPMSAFLRVTGFAELNKDDIACAMRMLPEWDEIDEWRATLPKTRRDKLNNPRQVAEAYGERGA